MSSFLCSLKQCSHPPVCWVQARRCLISTGIPSHSAIILQTHLKKNHLKSFLKRAEYDCWVSNFLFHVLGKIYLLQLQTKKKQLSQIQIACARVLCVAVCYGAIVSVRARAVRACVCRLSGAMCLLGLLISLNGCPLLPAAAAAAAAAAAVWSPEGKRLSAASTWLPAG